MSEKTQQKQRKKLCFVTIGATASFNSLITAVLEPDFLRALSTAGYTHLLIQHGSEGQSVYVEKTRDNPLLKELGITVDGFDFRPSGLSEEIGLAKGDEESEEGCVISHAGSGSILAALRVDVPLIVVPNTKLLDNHQVELAEALAGQGYVVHATVDNLPSSIEQAERLRQRRKEWPPVNSGQHRQARGLAGVMDEELKWKALPPLPVSDAWKPLPRTPVFQFYCRKLSGLTKRVCHKIRRHGERHPGYSKV